MDYVFEFLAQYSTGELLFAYLGLLFMTILGTLPSNSDLTIVAGAILASNGKFSIASIYFGVIAVVLIGENIAYYLGYHFGDFIFKLPLYRKLVNEKRKNNLELFVNRYPLRVLLSIRLTPVFRPVWYMMLGSLKVKPSIFFKMHTPIVISYNLLLITSSYFLSNYIDTYMKEYKVYALGAVFIIWFLAIRKMASMYKVEHEQEIQSNI
jgi:membrane protein DedA with SNARE-associated domain